jgi:hypothetical protein
MSSELDELRGLLEQLAEETESIPFSQLYTLSDLSGQKLAEFQTAWENFPASQRQRLIHALVELAEASFQVNFDAIFFHCMDDPAEEVRAAAIDGLWEYDQVALVGPLLAKLRADPAVQVRAAAAAGLGRYVLAGELEQLEAPIQNRILTELLTTIHLAGESVEVRRRAIESAAYACVPEVLELLQIAYYDEDERMRMSAVVGMGRSCDKRWRDIVVAELESRSTAMRYEAALACGELSLQSAVPTLTRLLDDADPEVRSASIWALGQINSSLAKQALLEAYDGADEETRAALEDALAEQALAEGEVEFVLYEMDNGLGADPLDNELLVGWPADDDVDDLDLEDWESDNE